MTRPHSFGKFLILLLLAALPARAESMLQLFNVRWAELAQKMPEIAEAGYDSLWLPPPYKATTGAASVGYDVFDPFDLGDINQNGTTATKWGTKAELLNVVRLAHRFGIRVYFDNVVNHRGNTVPGYNSSIPTNFYPGLLSQDFHLLTISSGFYRNMPDVSNYNDTWSVQNESLLGLVDLAQEPGSVNDNFGAAERDTIPKLFFVRQPTHRDYYMDTNLPAIAGPWHPFHGTNGQPSSEDVGAYMCRAVAWLINTTQCDGLRLDAVKHVPSAFFGDTTDSPNGFCGAVQTMFDYVHGYGHNVTGNGYAEADDNRNSIFDTEAPRNDALLVGEHLGEPPSYGEYIDRGMRLLNAAGQNALNGIIGVPGATMSGLDSPNWGAIIGFQGVQFSQSADNTYAGVSYAARALQSAYNFMRVGLPEIYSDGYNQTQGSSPFPGVPNANYLGEFGDQTMPDIATLQHQLARGLQTPRWSDSTVVCFERYDNREGSSGQPQDQVTVLFAMNDYMVAGQGDQCFYDTVGPDDACTPITNSHNVGLVVGFPPGSVLAQLASGPLHATNHSWAFDNSPACPTLLVRPATADLAVAQATASDPNPANRAIYVGGQTLAPGGGAVEFKIPAGSYVCYGYQWPEPSRAALTDAITFRQGGAAVPSLTFYRHDGTNGDPHFNPNYPFKMRGRIDQNGNVIGGQNVSNRVYAIDIPIVTNGLMDVLVRNDASSANVLVKLDGGVDLNSQMGLGPLTNRTAQMLDLRDNKPGYATDVFLGYEQSASDFRYGPEKFAAADITRDNVTASNAETYAYVVGGGNSFAPGAGNGAAVNQSAAAWVYHNPGDVVNIATNPPAAQWTPPAAGQPADVWVKVGYQFQVNQGAIYYTTDGSQPQGSFGAPQGTTRIAPLFWNAPDKTDPTIDWWKGTIPGAANANGAAVRYVVALYNTNIAPISDALPDKRYGLAQSSIVNFNPSQALVWTANDLNTNNVAAGLTSGFHIMRARSFLPRSGKSSVFNTFSQTFYYDAGPPAEQIVSPAPGATLTSGTTTIIVRADNSCTGAAFNINDSNPGNDDAVTGVRHGNGLSNGAPVFVSVAPSANTPSLDALYPDLPVEFHFLYAAVPASGSAVISVHLSEITTQLFPDRVGVVTQTFSTAAPAPVLQINSPAQDGAAFLLASTDTVTFTACFSQNLAVDASPFTVTVNGAPAPPGALSVGGAGCAAGLSRLNFAWTGAAPGTNLLNFHYQGDPTLDAARTVVVFDPHTSLPAYQHYVAGGDLKIGSVNNGLVTWDNVAGKKYQVLAATNLSQPFQAISPVLASTNAFFDSAFSNRPQKFYLIQVFP
ncbi:MAG TPA: alpha-amylase family glycosyl hydrolase [Verrucomicrobiae bacterium]|nr:alpha-amylase family glycosyl hydrolase [Verrucomicrobiae bacterium]